MGAQEDRLGEALREIGFVEAEKPPAPRLERLSSQARGQALELYRALGGVQLEPSLTTGPWDFAYQGNITVEFDESAHFSRYRAITLQPEWAQQLPWHHAYTSYALAFESNCVKERGWGGYWTNTSAEKMFGPAGPQRELDGPGAPRWKQRALYDAMRDLSAMHGDVKLIRLSIYDNLGVTTLGEVLKSDTSINANDLSTLISTRKLG